MTINDPGNAERAITVGSTHRDSPHAYGVSYFSSKGPTGDGRRKPDLVAPGERITSCAAGRELDAVVGRAGARRQAAVYVEDSGTSMAAPHVSGVVAAFLSVRREFIGQPDGVKEIFIESATTSAGARLPGQRTGRPHARTAIRSDANRTGARPMTEIARTAVLAAHVRRPGRHGRRAARPSLAEIPARRSPTSSCSRTAGTTARTTARRLYDAFFSMLASQLDQVPADRPVKVGLVGVFWPSQRWSDEPIPDFEPAAAKPAGGGAAAAEPVRATVAAGPPTLDPRDARRGCAAFPAGADNLNRMAELLAGKRHGRDDGRVQGRAGRLRQGDRGGRRRRRGRHRGRRGTPRMLDDDPADLFGRYANELRDSGVTSTTAAAARPGSSTRPRTPGTAPRRRCAS